MKNEDRSRKEDAILTQMDFCQSLMIRLVKSFKNGKEAQLKDPCDGYREIRNHTRYADDVRRIRRELMSLIKILEVNG